MTKLLSPLNQLIQILKDRGMAFQDLSKDNMVVVARAISLDSGLDVGNDKDAGFILGSYLLENEGRWSIVFQAIIRYCSEEPGLYSKENTLKLLEAAKGIYEKNVPFLDVEQNLPIEWNVVHDETMVTKAGQAYATVDGAVTLGNMAVTDIVTLLESLANLPTVELVDGTNMTPEEIQKEME